MAVAAESGCKAVFVGLETVSQHSLDLQAKRFNQVRLYERAVVNLHRHGTPFRWAPCPASMATTRGSSSALYDLEGSASTAQR